MSSALECRPIDPSDITLINHQYLSHGSRPDPTMVWGTEFDAENVMELITARNRTSRTLVSLSHVLIKAVAHALVHFPQLNCRIIHGRIYRFREVNIRLINYNTRSADIDIFMIRQADQLNLEEIGSHLWSGQLGVARGNYADCRDKALLNWGPSFTRRLCSRLYWWLDRNLHLPRVGNIDRHLDSGVVVNYLGFPGSPPMRMYKPSKFPDESSLLSVTVGRTESRAVVRDGRVVARRIAPLFVRGDHRVTNAHTLGRFTGMLHDVLADPNLMEMATGDESSRHRAA